MKFSIELSRGTDVAKADKHDAGTVRTSLAGPNSPLAAALRSDGPAVGDVPNPGPVPMLAEQPASTSKEPVSAAPIRWQYPYAVNQTLTPRGEDRRLTPFAQLRVLADVCDLVRIAIEARKDQMSALSWDFAPRERSHNRSITEAEKTEIKKLRAFFRRPDRVNTWNTWLRMVIEEVLVIDALSIYKRKTKGGALFSLEVVDGTTIKPLLGPRGFVPLPPSVAYRQIINGLPVRGGDCTIETMMYRPRTVRTWTPYGLSPVECVMLTVNTMLNRQVFNLSHYSEGNIPEGLVSVPEGWSTDQIREFQTYWDTMIAGNHAMRQRLRFVGPKMAESVYQFKKETTDTKYDEWLLQVVCAAFNVQPQELGFTQQINKSQGESQENVTYRRGIKPLGRFIKDIVDEVVVDTLEAVDFECIFTGGESEDRKAQAEIDKIYWAIGKVSTDELRARDGEEQIGLGPLVMTAKGPVFVEQLVKDKDNNPLTSNVRDAASPLDDDSVDGPKPKLDDADVDDVDDDAETAKAIDGELRAFKRFLVNRVQKGRTLDAAAGAFESAVLPLAVRSSIVEKIAATAGADKPSVGDVVSTFDVVEKAAAPKRLRVQAQSRIKKFARGYFADLAVALSSDLAGRISES